MTAALFRSLSAEGLRLSLRANGVLAVSGPAEAKDKARPYAEGLKAFLARSLRPDWPDGTRYEGSGLEACLAVLAASFDAEAEWSLEARKLAAHVEALDTAARSGRTAYSEVLENGRESAQAWIDAYRDAHGTRHRVLCGRELYVCTKQVFMAAEAFA